MLSCAVVSMLASSGAWAYPLVLTFDHGDYDPNLLPYGHRDWIEDNGIRAEGFWAVDVGTPGAYFREAHNHIQPPYCCRPEARPYGHHAATNDVQGLIISLESGESFDVVSIQYLLTVRVDYNDPYLQRVDWVWTPEDAQMLLATSFDPTRPDFSNEWTPFAIDDSDTEFPQWYTAEISGFDDVTSFLWTSTAASMLIDTIVLDVHPAVVPEPSTGALAVLGIAAVVAAGRRRHSCGR